MNLAKMIRPLFAVCALSMIGAGIALASRAEYGLAVVGALLWLDLTIGSLRR